MGGPINTKGVTSSFTRHLGGGFQNSNKRFLDSIGYEKAFKKAFKTTDLNKIKNYFKEAGIKTNRFSTRQPIKEKDFLDDLKKAARAGILKNPESVQCDFRRMQTKEDRDLKRKEGRAFNMLSRGTKRRLVWAEPKRIVSAGAKKAAEDAKVRDIEIRKVGDVGISGFGTLEKQGDATLWRRYKALKGARHRNEAALHKLKELDSKIRIIRLQARKDANILKKYGIPEMKKSKSVWRSKKKVGAGREDSKVEVGKNNAVVSEEIKKEDKKDKSLSSGGGVDIMHGSGSAPPTVDAVEKHEMPPLPFSVVSGGKGAVERDGSVQGDELGSRGVELDDGLEQEEKSEQERQFGFIDLESGEVKLYSADRESGVGGEIKKAA